MRLPQLRLPLWLKTIAFAGVYFCAARLGLLLAFAHSNASPVWPPSGIAVAALLLLGMCAWPGVMIGAFAANFVVFTANQTATDITALALSTSIAIGNTLEAIVASYLIRGWFADNEYFSAPVHVAQFAAAATVGALLSAGVGCATLITGEIVPLAAAPTVALTWWLGDLSGMLVLTPLLLMWKRSRHSIWPQRTSFEILFSILLLISGLWLIFGSPVIAARHHGVLAFTLLPGIAWFAWRFGPRGTTLTSLIISMCAVWSSTQGIGAFAFGTLNESLLTLQCFMALICLTGLLLAADLQARAYHLQLSVASIPAQRIAGHWSALLLGLGISVLGWQWMTSATEQHALNRFKMLADEVEQKIEVRLADYAQVLRSAQGLFRASVTVERGEWHAFIENLMLSQIFPGIQGIGYAQRIKAAELNNIEELVQHDGYPEFRVWPRSPEREEYTAIIYLEPFDERNHRAFGYDMTSEAVRHAAMLKARDSAMATISGQVILKQENQANAQPGFLMYLPIFDNTLPNSTIAERRTALRGYVYMPFRINDFMQGLFGNTATAIGFRIFDGAQSDPAPADNTSPFYASSNLTSADRWAYPHPLRKSTQITLAQHLWTLEVVSLPGFEAGIDRQKSIMLLLSGSLISFLLFFIVRNQMTRHEETLALAARMTTAFTDSEIRFSTLINAADEFAIIATNANGGIRMFSTGAEKMLGYSSAEMVDCQNLTVIYHRAELRERAVTAHKEGEANAIDILAGAARHGQTETREWTYQHKNGGLIPVQVTVSAVSNSTGNILGYISIAKDVRREREAAAALQIAKENAESASKAKSTFVANMSHEIRTPLNAVLGITELLTKTPLSGDQKRFVEMVRAAGRSLLHVLNDILDFSKMEAGRLELAVRPFRLDELLNVISTLMSASARNKDLELAIGIDEDVPNHLIGDSLRLQQILINLIGNAIKFTEHGEVALLIKLVALTGKNATLSFRVHDTGIGMTPEQLARIFTPFSQADESTTRLVSGTGLGLTISDNLIRLMGGEISVNSTFGEGSAFEIKVPLQLDVSQQDKHLGNSLPKRRLLIIDDNATSRDYIARTVSTLGWQADTEPSAQNALEKLKTAAPYDAVLIDWKLADMDSLQLMSALKDSHISQVPLILMISALVRSELLQAERDSPADAVMIKPITTSSLTDTLQAVFARQGTPRTDTINDAASALRLEGMHLLIVEDNQLNQVVARGLLENAGASIEIAENGQQALDMLRRAPERYHAVLMDAQMPVMDGMTATRIIRNELGSSLPIFAMTAAVMETERESYLAAGMNDIIAKPIDSHQLFATIQRYVIKHPVSLTSSAMNMEEAEPFDYDNGFSAVLVGTAVGSVMNVIKKMIAHGDEPLRTAEELWREGKREEAARIFHTLRGSLGMFGSPLFLTATQELEHAILKNNSMIVTAQLAIVRREFEFIQAAAQRWLATQQKENGGGASFSKETLKKLLGLLAQQNLAACSLYEQLRPELAQHLTAESLDEVDSSINNLSFDRAITILRAVTIA
jgi:PAS domain S-box-containing protein